MSRSGDGPGGFFFALPSPSQHRMSDEAIPAATLIVVRDRANTPPELLMVERADGMAFAAGALVFPGGRIDKADGELGIDAALVAAVRETVEETAIPVGLEPILKREAALELQSALVADEPFGELLSRVGLNIAADIAACTAAHCPISRMYVSASEADPT